MNSDNKYAWIALPVFVTLLLMIACSLSTAPDSVVPAPTSTPTVLIGVEEPTSISNKCDGLSGYFEMQLLVGPSDAVGLEPFAVGEIPFSVEGTGQSYSLQGGDNITYEEVLQEEWGTYTVSFNMDVSLDGQCSGEAGSEVLDVLVNMSGDQMVEVEAEGFQGEYPWTGTHQQSLTFPLQEGASAEGEGWALVLHLD